MSVFTIVLILMTLILGLSGIVFFIWSIFRTRNKFYVNYIRRRNDKEHRVP